MVNLWYATMIATTANGRSVMKMRFIDADKLHFSPRFAWATPDRESMVPVLAVDKELVDKAPTIDAVPVVRCRDCKYFVDLEPLDPCECMHWMGRFSVAYTEPNGFCSYGERKDGET